MILSEDQIQKILKKNSKITPSWIMEARDYRDTLFALIEGEDFDKLLEKVEHIEGTKKAVARRKYARNVKDMFERLLRMTDNIYSATGGIKRYIGLSDSEKETLVKSLSNVRGGESLESWLENNWKQLYHLDPNGIIFLEYMEGLDPYPTYKSIKSIRNYLQNGQKLEWLLFEPVELEDGVKEWRLVDDEKDYTIIQNGETFTIDEDDSFEHGFGKTPALVNSNINKIGYKNLRLSPVDKIIEIAKEYSRDLSIKTIYKFLQGFPKHWRYTAPCPDCHGTGKDGEDTCGTCNGTGETTRNDVTDEIRLAIPEADEVVLAPNVAGYITPDLETWDKFTEELQQLEDLMTLTHWGSIVNTEAVQTATETVIDTQPTIQRLNKYSDVAENMEKQLTEMIANHLFPNKDKGEQVASINYGRNFIIEALSTVLERYQSSKTAGDNATILDRQYQEYLLSKYKSDPVGLKIAMLKSKVEPYIHYTAEQVAELMGAEEGQKKVLFDDFWKTVTDYDQDAEKLQNDFLTWFERQKPQAEEPEAVEPVEE
jgi:hypothetical protein